MKNAVLVIIKPDGLTKGIEGQVLSKFAQADLDIVAARVLHVTRTLAEEHYSHIKGQPFFEDVIKYLMGVYHPKKKVMGIVYYGEKAIKKCREIAGATNPEAADPKSIRGAFGRITTKGVYENIVHVSSDPKEAEREIKLWFAPDDLPVKLYKSKMNTEKRRVWA